MTSPPHPPEPRPRRNDGRALHRRRDRRPQAREPSSRRSVIEPAATGLLLAPCVEHVDESMAHLARARELAGVVTVAPHASAATERAIDRLGDTNGEPLEPTAKAHV